jgi:hypothetical protein
MNLKERRAGREETENMPGSGQGGADEGRLLEFPLFSSRFARGFPDDVNFSGLRTIGLTARGCGLIEGLVGRLGGECTYPPFG